MLWPGDISLLHVQSNGWALSRGIFPVCDKLWLTLRFQEASEHTYWQECC